MQTTISQSKRLLAAGYMPETADGSYTVELRDQPVRIIPSWSFAALWELAGNYGHKLQFSTHEDKVEWIMECLVNELCNEIEFKP